MREADFSERIKRVPCERVGGRCSNPKCRSINCEDSFVVVQMSR